MEKCKCYWIVRARAVRLLTERKWPVVRIQFEYLRFTGNWPLATGADSDALRPPTALLLALRHDRRTEAAAKVFGKFVELRVAVDLDGLLGSVANNIAVVA